MKRLLGRSEEGCHFNCQVCGDADLHSGREINSPSLYFQNKQIFIQPNCIRDGWKSGVLCRDKDILLPVCGIISSPVKDHPSFIS